MYSCTHHWIPVIRTRLYATLSLSTPPATPTGPVMGISTFCSLKRGVESASHAHKIPIRAICECPFPPFPFFPPLPPLPSLSFSSFPSLRWPHPLNLPSGSGEPHDPWQRRVIRIVIYRYSNSEQSIVKKQPGSVTHCSTARTCRQCN